MNCVFNEIKLSELQTDGRLKMSNIHNEEIMERLYDEAYAELWGSYLINSQEQHHDVALEWATKRFEETVGTSDR